VAERDLISVDDAAAEFGVSRGTIFAYLRDGKLRRWEMPMDRRTFVDRRELRRLRQPRLKEH
jgi:predicted site-specific integrase-resolvase